MVLTYESSRNIDLASAQQQSEFGKWSGFHSSGHGLLYLRRKTYILRSNDDVQMSGNVVSYNAKLFVQFSGFSRMYELRFREPVLP